MESLAAKIVLLRLSLEFLLHLFLVLALDDVVGRRLGGLLVLGLFGGFFRFFRNFFNSNRRGDNRLRNDRLFGLLLFEAEALKAPGVVLLPLPTCLLLRPLDN